MTKIKLKTILYADNKRFTLISMLFIVIAIVVSILSITSGTKEFWGGQYTHYNNYVIFKTSYLNLLNNVNLYAFHPNQYADLYKYSPTFALFMGLFYYLPDWLGLSLWQLLNCGVFLYGVYKLSILDGKEKNILLLFCLVESVTSLQNHQSNLLLTGLILLFFQKYISGQNKQAGFFILLAAFIKIYCLALAPIFLINKKLNLSQLIFIVPCFCVLFILPAFITGINALAIQYKNWWFLLQQDYNGLPGHSIHGLLLDTLRLPIGKNVINFIGFGSVILAFIFTYFSTNKNRELVFFVFLCIWMIVFNHKAESPTYILAVCPALIWMLANKNLKRKYVWCALFILFTSLITTDLFPPSVRTGLFEPYHLKAIASSILFLYLFSTILQNFIKSQRAENHSI